MSVHRFEATQLLRVPRDTAWRFFSNPRNLSRITPRDMRFTVTSDLPDEIYPGLMITYRVHPLFDIPVSWVTEITHVTPCERFVDEQRVGPYALWHHEHHFRDVDGGTGMRDLVHYSVPGGPLGDVINRLLVQRRVAEIFAYRRRVIERLFGTTPRDSRPALVT